MASPGHNELTNGLSPVKYQAITGIYADLLASNWSKMCIKIWIFSLNKRNLIMVSAKSNVSHLFSGLNVLTPEQGAGQRKITILGAFTTGWMPLMIRAHSPKYPLALDIFHLHWWVVKHLFVPHQEQAKLKRQVCKAHIAEWKQERLKCRNTLGCLDQYAAQNSKYARPQIPSQPPTQKVFFQRHTQYRGLSSRL